jgi:hypothetical protein
LLITSLNQLNKPSSVACGSNREARPARHQSRGRRQAGSVRWSRRGWASRCRRSGGSPAVHPARRRQPASTASRSAARRRVPRLSCRRARSRDSRVRPGTPVRREQIQGPGLNRCLMRPGESRLRRRRRPGDVVAIIFHSPYVNFFLVLLLRRFTGLFFSYILFEEVARRLLGRLKRLTPCSCQVMLMVEHPQVQVAFGLVGEFLQDVRFRGSRGRWAYRRSHTSA